MTPILIGACECPGTVSAASATRTRATGTIDRLPIECLPEDQRCGSENSASSALAQDDVHRALARNVLHAIIAEHAGVDAAQNVLAGAEQHRADGQMQLVDQPRAQILANRGDAAAETDVAAPRGCLR